MKKVLFLLFVLFSDMLSAPMVLAENDGVLAEYRSQVGSWGLDGVYPTFVVNGVAASSLDSGGGYLVEPTWVEIAGPNLGVVVHMAMPGAQDISAMEAVEQEHYFFFTLKAEGDKKLFVTNLSMEIQSASNGKRKFTVYATPTGGVESGETFGVIEEMEVPTYGRVKQEPGAALASADLSGIKAFQGIDSLEVKLIFHGFGSNPEGDAGRTRSQIDNLSIQGRVSAP